MKYTSLLFVAALPGLSLAQEASVEDTDQNFSGAPESVIEDWIYNDLDRGFAEAKATGKPLMVVYRCIP